MKIQIENSSSRGGRGGGGSWLGSLVRWLVPLAFIVYLIVGFLPVLEDPEASIYYLQAIESVDDILLSEDGPSQLAELSPILLLAGSAWLLFFFSVFANSYEPWQGEQGRNHPDSGSLMLIQMIAFLPVPILLFIAL